MQVVHDKIGVAEASVEISNLMKSGSFVRFPLAEENVALMH